MTRPPRFSTIRVGMVTVTFEGQVLNFEVRVLRDSGGFYRLLAGTLSEPLPSIEHAVLRAEEPELGPAEAVRTVHWRDDAAPVEPVERPCPICGAPASVSPRYTHLLCPACVLEAADLKGRSLRLQNTGTSGGFEARYADDGTLYDSDECYVRGIPCRMGEHRLGGVVIQPITVRPGGGTA